MKDTVNKIVKAKSVTLKSLCKTGLSKISTLVTSKGATKKRRVRKPSKYQVNAKVAKYCFAIAFDRFNNGGYCVNLKDHSRH